MNKCYNQCDLFLRPEVECNFYELREKCTHPEDVRIMLEKEAEG